MKTLSSDITEFYKQLSLLIRSDLPLPDTLEQMGKSFSKKSMRKVLHEMSRQTAQGRKLSDAMREHRELFSDDQIKLVEVGEDSDTLPSVLADLAKISQMNYKLYLMFKDILTYPAFTVSLAILVFFVLCVYVIPEYENIYKDLLEGEPLPILTELVIDLASLIRTFFPILMILYVAYAIFVIWLLSPSYKAYKWVIAAMNCVSFSDIISYNFAMARIATIWALFMRKKVPVAECFPVIAHMIEFPELRETLIDIAENCSQGEPFLAAIEHDKDISELMKMLIANTPEDKLPDELEKLAPLFMDRAYYGFRRLGMFLETVTVTGMVLVTGSIIILLFSPLIIRVF